jgi:hypothetical protein
MKQTLTVEVENPLGLYDGCYALQRNGKISGPWIWGKNVDEGHGWLCFNGKDFDETHRHNTGRFFLDVEHELDLIQVVSSPESLPNPIEGYYNAYPDKHFMFHETKEDAIEHCAKDGTTYRIRIELLEKIVT